MPATKTDLMVYHDEDYVCQSLHVIPSRSRSISDAHISGTVWFRTIKPETSWGQAGARIGRRKTSMSDSALPLTVLAGLSSLRWTG